MTRSLSALALVAFFVSAASAGTVPVVKRDAVHAPAPNYLVTANLNKLVFWHVPSRGSDHAQR